MVTFRESNASNFATDDDDDSDEEPGEVIESAPPLKVGEVRNLGSSGLKKKLLRHGCGFELPDFGDEVTINFVGSLVDGTKFVSDENGQFLQKVGDGKMVSGLDRGIITMKKLEKALFTLPPELAYGEAGTYGVPPNSVILFEVELLSWIPVIDIFKDGGVIKRILVKGEQTGKPSDKDEVIVRYDIRLADGTLLLETPEEGVEFSLNEGHLFPALPKAVMTMNRKEKVNLVVQPKYAYQGGSTNSVDNSSLIPPNSVLSIDLELLSFKPVIRVTNDSKVIKKILKEGQGGLTADEGASVTIRYKAMLEDGSVFEKKGYDGEEALQFVTDEEHVVPGLDRAAMTMRKGEHAIISVDPEYGYRDKEVRKDLATVPPFSTLSYEVEMLDFAKVLDIEFYNIKALYRRTQAYMEIGDYLLAEADIKKALDTDPENREVKVAYNKLKKLQAESNKRDAKLYANMFSQMTKRLKLESVEGSNKNAVTMGQETEKVGASCGSPNDEMIVENINVLHD